MGLPTLPLQKIIDSEELLVIVNDKIYVTGDFSLKTDAEAENNFENDSETENNFETEKEVGDKKDFIELDGLRFSLEECESGRELFEFYLKKYQREIEEEFISTSDDTTYVSWPYREYVLENRILEFILSLFERLKPEISYKEHLKMNGYRKLDVPDRVELEGIISEISNNKLSEKSINDLEGEIIDEIKLIEKLKKINSPLNNMLILKGVVFHLERSISEKNEDEKNTDEKKKKKDEQRNTSSTQINIDGVRYYIHLPDYNIREFKKIITAREEVISNELKLYSSQYSSSKRMELAKRKRAYLQKKFDEGDYLSHGLVFEKSSEDEQYPIYIIKMVLPTYKIKIPKHSYDIVFQQAELKTTIRINEQGQTVLKIPITYSNPAQHPLVIPQNYSDRDQVCLREFKKELERHQREGLLEYLAAHFLLDRHVLFYGANMFNLVDHPLMILTGTFNPHRLTRKKHTYQRVPRGQNDGILLINAQ